VNLTHNIAYFFTGPAGTWTANFWHELFHEYTLPSYVFLCLIFQVDTEMPGTSEASTTNKEYFK